MKDKAKKIVFEKIIPSHKGNSLKEKMIEFNDNGTCSIFLIFENNKRVKYNIKNRELGIAMLSLIPMEM